MPPRLLRKSSYALEKRHGRGLRHQVECPQMADTVIEASCHPPISSSRSFRTLPNPTRFLVHFPWLIQPFFPPSLSYPPALRQSTGRRTGQGRLNREESHA